ncbi:MAG: alpha/beta hydrolase [archaeon]|nr:alpha/beta hydrolase [archaeon]
MVVFDFLVNEFKAEKQNIFIFGRSIGTTAAIYLSSQRKPGALISVSGFTTIKNVAKGIVGGMLGLLVKDRFTSIEYIKNVTCPVLFIHGQKDKLIPFTHSLELKENCSGPYEILLPEEMTHNEFDYDDDLINPVKNFLEKNTGIQNEGKPIVLPKYIFDTPLVIKQQLRNSNLFEDKESNSSCCK